VKFNPVAQGLRAILTLHSEVSEVFQAASASLDCRRIPIPCPVLKQLRLILTPEWPFALVCFRRVGCENE